MIVAHYCFLPQLRLELEAADPPIECGAGLVATTSTSAGDPPVVTMDIKYADVDGTITELPPEAQPILDAHEPQDVVAATEQAESSVEFVSQYQEATDRLDEIIALGTGMTQAQARDAVLDLARLSKKTIRFIKTHMR